MTHTPDDPLPNLASARLGAEVISVTDQFFAAAERMLAETDPVFLPDKFDDHGKWMDGWETRRRRGPGHDHAVIRLGAAGRVQRLEIDTRHFTGNYPMAASLEYCHVDSEPGEQDWRSLLPVTSLQGDHRHPIELPEPVLCSHLRLHIYPDGGIARLRVYGTPEVNWNGLTGEAVPVYLRGAVHPQPGDAAVGVDVQTQVGTQDRLGQLDRVAVIALQGGHRQ